MHFGEAGNLGIAVKRCRAIFLRCGGTAQHSKTELIMHTLRGSEAFSSVIEF